MEPDAWNLPSPKSDSRSSPQANDGPEVVCTLEGDLFKKPSGLRSQGAQLKHEVKTMQAELQEFSEMMACQLGFQRTEYSSLRTKAHALSTSFNSTRLDYSAIA